MLPPILFAAPVNALGLGVEVVTPPAAEVATAPTVLGEEEIISKLTLGNPVPVPITPLEEADPVW